MNVQNNVLFLVITKFQKVFYLHILYFLKLFYINYKFKYIFFNNLRLTIQIARIIY